MNIGDLRHRIEIGRCVEGKDQWGDPLPESTWQRVAKPWASVEALKGSSYFQSQQTVAQSDHEITIRYRKGIEAGMIVRHDGREFTVQAPLDKDGKRRWLTLLCREVRPT